MRIPVAQIPNLAGASFNSTAPANLMAGGRALQRVGAAVSQTSRVSSAYDKKKEKLSENAAVSSYEIERANADADIRSHQLANPDDTKGWMDMRNKRYEALNASVKMEGMSAEAMASVQQLIERGDAKSKTGINGQMEKRSIDNSNALIRANGDRMLRNGDREGAIKEYGRVQVPNHEKIEMIENALSEGLYNDVQTSIKSGSIEDAEAELERLRERGKGGDYANYEDDMGGLSKKQRSDLENFAYSHAKGRKLKAKNEVMKAQDAIQKGEGWAIPADASEDQAVALEQLASSTSIGSGINSPEYETLSKEISGLGNRTMGMGDTDQGLFEAAWEKVNGGHYDEENKWIETGEPFNREARFALIGDLLESEANEISDNEEDVEGQFYDRTLTNEERIVRESLRSVVEQGLAAVSKDPLMTTLTPESYSRAYRKLLKRVRADADAGRISPDKVNAYLQNDLKQMITEEIQPIENQRLRDQMRGEPVKAKPSEYTKGQRATQGGKTYEFDGTNWNEVN